MAVYPLFPFRSIPIGNPTEILGRFAEEPRETIEAHRRRQGSEGGPRGRADMPGRPSQSGGGGGSGSGGKRSMSVGGLILVVVIYLVIKILFGGSDQASQEEVSQVDNTTAPAEKTPTRRPTKTPVQEQAAAAVGDSSQTWTVMLYQDADDPVLEQDIMMDLNEAELVGSSQQVNIVAQIDRYKGAYAGDGDWTSTRRYHLTQDDDLFYLNSEMVEDLGEVSMADPQTLVDFATWAMQTYPADRYVLILSDHGMGWPGGMTDPKPAAARNVDNNFAQAVSDNMMYTNEISQALADILGNTGVDRFEVVGMDACLMAHVEVYSALAPYAHYAVSSQETEPALGWAYAGFLQALKDNPGMTGAELSEKIVSSYIDEDERIVDDQARREYLRQGSPLGSLFSAQRDVDPAQLSRQIGRSVTLTAVDLDAFSGLMDSVNQMAYALQMDKQAVVARSRTYAQSFTSVFGSNVPASYIDLGNFAALMAQQSDSATVRAAADEVADQVDEVVIAERHGNEKPGATGISIYFPNSTLYQNGMVGGASYVEIADTFARESLWDEFLAYHYTKESFEMETGQVVAPGKNTRVTAPGEGAIEISDVQLSTDVADYNEPVTLQADLTGTNIGYVYLFVGYYDENSNSVLVADKDFLQSDEIQQINDLYYPVWSDNKSFTLKYVWTPTVFAINDGTQSAVALLNPERFGESEEEAVYTTDGYFTDAATGQTRYARMYFSNGKLDRVVGFTGMDPTGMVSEITPQSGDQITLIQTWLELKSDNSYQQVSENGQTLTFGNTSFTWEELYADSGSYVVGFVVSDLDGSEVQSLGAIQIR